MTNAKMIYDSHEAYPEKMKRSLRLPRPLRAVGSKMVNTVEKTLARLCILVITADDATRDSFRNSGISATTIFNFPPLNLFEPDPQLEAELKRRFENRTLIIYQGTMSEERGLFHMIRAMRTVNRNDPSILLLLIGLDEPGLRARAEKMIHQYQIADAVEILPWVDHEQIGSFMRICDIGLIPWQPSEKHLMNIPIKLFEYMACGLPILTADLPPTTTFIRRSGAGWIYDSTDDQAMADCVLGMLADPGTLRLMSKNGLESVGALWNWSQMEKKLLGIYRRIELAT